MEFACRGRPAADEGGDDSRRSPDPPLPHDFHKTGTGDAMLVIRDALLLQLQKDRLRQEIIMAELAKIDRAMAFCSAGPQGVATVHMERPEPVFFTLSDSEESTLRHCRWPAGSEHYFSNVGDVHDLKKKDVNHGDVQLKSEKSATEDISSECSRPCCSNGKAGDENAVFDQQNLQESNAPKKPPSLKWELTEITIPVKKTKPLQSWRCAICQVETPNTEHSLQQHCAGKKHRSNVAAMELRNKAISQEAEITPEPSSCADQKTSPIKWSCSTCQVNGTSEVDLKEHINGRTHQQNIEAQSKEAVSVAKSTEPQEPELHKSNVPQNSEKPPCSNSLANCISESELGRQLVTEIQALLDAINNITTNSESHEAESSPNIVPHGAEQTSQSVCSLGEASSEYQSCSSEPQVENPRSTRRRRKKSEALLGGGHDAETGDMKQADKLFPDGSDNRSISSEEQQTSCYCQICNLELKSASILADHCKGEEHLEKQRLVNFCWVCNLQCNSAKMLAHHRTGKKHQKNLNANK
ncbi:hypothetical protein BS78_02G185700 [Paspalum vaginatum]|nr:hypothetical protein BS78_02G185700 [Paspalum vaginatum]